MPFYTASNQHALFLQHDSTLSLEIEMCKVGKAWSTLENRSDAGSRRFVDFDVVIIKETQGVVEITIDLYLFI